MDATQGVSVVVARTIRPGLEAEYEDWLRRAIAAAGAWPGHLGAQVVRPAAPARQYVLVFRFAELEQLLAWEASPEKSQLVSEADRMAEGAATVQRASGLETWFTLPGGGTLLAPPKWKMALVSWGVAFPTIQILSTLLGPLLHDLPALLRGAIIGAALVGIMTWVAMPRVTRALAGWLYPGRRPS